MKTTLMTSIVIASSLLSSVAMAHGNNNHGPQHQYQNNRPTQINQRVDRHQHRDYREDRTGRRDFERRDQGNHYGHYRQNERTQFAYKHGDRLPNYYLSNRYYVNDWRARRLPEPPQGYRWVDVEGRYILAAIATGIISQIILGY